MTYGLGAWIVYVALWWFGVVGAAAGLKRALSGAPVIGGPVVWVLVERGEGRRVELIPVGSAASSLRDALCGGGTSGSRTGRVRWFFQLACSSGADAGITEATLRTLKKEQRDKVEELKRKTGYYSTRNLLEKYDEVIKKNVRPPALSAPDLPR